MSNEKHLIFVQSLFYPDHSAGSQMLTDLSFYLVENGFKVTIITSRKFYGAARDSLPKFEEINKVNVYRQWSLNFGRNFLIGRFLDYISLEISMLIGIYNLTRKNDIVIILTDPPLLNVIASPIIALRGGLIVNWLQDLFPEVAVGAGILSQSSFLNKFITKIRNKALKKANKNVAIGQSMNHYLTRIGISSKKIIRIDNWADGNAIMPIPNNENYLRKEWGLEDKFVIGYSGNLGRAHDVFTILKAVEQLQYDNQFSFLFIGGGNGMDVIKKYSQERKFNNVIFKPYQSRNLLHLSLGAADIHWITLEPQMESFIVPSKVYGILAAAKPIIFLGHNDGEIAKVISKTKCGKTIDIGDSAALVATIKKLSKDLKLLKEMGQRGRIEFQEKYDFHVSAKKFSKLFHDISLSSYAKIEKNL